MKINSFYLRLTAYFAALVLLCCLLLAFHFDRLATLALTEAAARNLFNTTRSAAMQITVNMQEREREVLLLSRSHLLKTADLRTSLVSNRLQDIQQSYPYYAWIGIAAPDGEVLNATGKLLVGENVAARPWFQAGLKGPYVGDVHKALLLEQLLQPNSTEPLRFIDFVAPLYDETGQVKAVLGTHVDWAWVAQLLSGILDGATEQQLEFFILDAKQQWLYPFSASNTAVPPLPDTGQTTSIRWPDQQHYLTSVVQIQTNQPALQWQLVLRQPVTTALTPVKLLHQQILWLALALIALGLLLSLVLARQFSLPIIKLARDARSISSTKLQDFQTESSLTEIRELANALHTMLQSLQHKQRQLTEANNTLEQQVAERTLELQHANQVLEQLSLTDPLTGVANRRRAEQQLQLAMAQFQRYQTPGSVLLLDIDHFKRINDNFGHDIGDLVLKQLAQAWQAELRSSDLLARLGGEEFLVLATQTNLDDAVLLAEKLRVSTAALHIPQVGKVTVSIGVAPFTPDNLEHELFLKQADEALYRAKQTGRNQVRLALS